MAQFSGEGLFWYAFRALPYAVASSVNICAQALLVQSLMPLSSLPQPKAKNAMNAMQRLQEKFVVLVFIIFDFND
ncbi:MAG: hypothetical protein CMH45_07420 [Muricauda sp.]|nr:hypothetical protein [Allomuricauda sp.]